MRVGGFFTTIRMIKNTNFIHKSRLRADKKFTTYALNEQGWERKWLIGWTKKMASIEIEAVPNPQVLEALIKLAKLMEGGLGGGGAETDRETNSPTGAI